MTTYKMTDAAFFSPAMLAGADAVACYIGGADAAHVWSVGELEAAEHFPRLPIWVPPPAASTSQAVDDMWAILHLMIGYRIPRGQTIAFDLETSKADLAYMRTVADGLRFFGYGTIAYGSLSTITGAVPPYLWKWSASWTGVPHLDAGMVATQWTDGPLFDQSVISQELYNTLLWRAK